MYDDDSDDGYGGYDESCMDEFGRSMGGGRQRERTVTYVHELNLDLDVRGDNCFLVLTARQSKSGAKALSTSEGVSTPSWEQVSLEELPSSYVHTTTTSPCFLEKWASARGAGHAIVRPTWCPYE